MKQIFSALKIIKNSTKRGKYFPKGENTVNQIKESDSNKSICILVHSWLGNSKEMSYLADKLFKNGISTLNILLSGHGTVPEDLLNYKHLDWLIQIDDAVRCAEKKYKKIILIGQCGGSNLILNYLYYLRKSNKIKGLVIASTPIFYSSKEVTQFAIVFNFCYRYFFRILEIFIHPFFLCSLLLEFKIPKSEKIPWEGYCDLYPVYAIGEGTELLRKSSKIRLKEIPYPAFVIHNKRDHFYSLKHCIKLFEEINNKRGNDILLIDNNQFGIVSGHAVFNNLEELENIFPKVLNFINTRTGENSHE